MLHVYVECMVYATMFYWPACLCADDTEPVSYNCTVALQTDNLPDQLNIVAPVEYVHRIFCNNHQRKIPLICVTSKWSSTIDAQNRSSVLFTNEQQNWNLHTWISHIRRMDRSKAGWLINDQTIIIRVQSFIVHWQFAHMVMVQLNHNIRETQNKIESP